MKGRLHLHLWNPDFRLVRVCLETLLLLLRRGDFGFNS